MSVVATIDALTRHAKGKKEKSIYVEQAHFVGVDNSDDYYYRFGASSAGRRHRRLFSGSCSAYRARPPKRTIVASQFQFCSKLVQQR